jgi:hypothetical protein
MIFIINFKQLDMNIMNNEKYSFYLNEVRKNLAANVDRPPFVLRTCEAVQIRSGSCVRGNMGIFIYIGTTLVQHVD